VTARLARALRGDGSFDLSPIGEADLESPAPIYGPQRHKITPSLMGRRSKDPSATVRPRVLFIDNYDSFVFNLAQYVGELGARTEVVRHDEASVDELLAGDFTHVVVSPGPGTPADAGVSAEVVRRFGVHTPVLGVCLGHQVIGEVFGARVVRADHIVHG